MFVSCLLFQASIYSTALKTLISVSTVILVGLICAYHALEVQVGVHYDDPSVLKIPPFFSHNINQANFNERAAYIVITTSETIQTQTKLIFFECRTLNNRSPHSSHNSPKIIHFEIFGILSR